LVNKLVLENLRHRPIRTCLGVLAVGVEVTMILTLVGLSHGMLDDMARRSRGVGADVIIRPPGTSVIGLSSAPMPEKILGFATEQPGVELVTGTAVHPVGGVDLVTGIDLDSFSRMCGGFRYLEGGPFQSPDDMIVDERYARQKKLHAGSHLQMMNRTWRIAGIVEQGKLARMFLPLRVLQDLTANTGKLSVVYIKLTDPKQTPQFVAALKEKLKDYQIYSMDDFVGLMSADNVPGFNAFLGVVIGVSVVVGFLVVFLSMYTAVLERTREIGILKALGASPSFILTLLFRETVILAIIGSLAGVLLTFGTRWLITKLVPGSLTQAVVPEWWPIAGGIAVAGALLGTIYPGWKAAKQDAIEALAYE
jgi:putative ABC transport system permease protein